MNHKRIFPMLMAAVLPIALLGQLPAIANTSKSVNAPSIDRFVNIDPKDIPTGYRPSAKAVSRAVGVKVKPDGVYAATSGGLVFSQLPYEAVKPKKFTRAMAGVLSADSWETVSDELTMTGAKVTKAGGVIYLFLASGSLYAYGAMVPTNGYLSVGQCQYSKKVKASQGRACAKRILDLVVARPI